jgi:hypothetical protein
LAGRKIRSKDVEDAVVLKKASSGYDDIGNEEEAEAVENGGGKENKGEKKGNVIDFPKDGSEDKPEGSFEIILNKQRDEEDFKRFEFVMRALDFKDGRLFKRMVRIERDGNGKPIAVGTDGRRLHYAEVENDIPIGNFYPDKIQKSGNIILRRAPDDNEKFPDWRRTIDAEFEKVDAEINLDGAGLSKDRNKTAKITTALHAILKAALKLINIGYLNDLEKGVHEIFIEKRKNGPVKFKLNSQKEISAYIMPMALE